MIRKPPAHKICAKALVYKHYCWISKTKAAPNFVPGAVESGSRERDNRLPPHKGRRQRNRARKTERIDPARKRARGNARVRKNIRRPGGSRNRASARA